MSERYADYGEFMRHIKNNNIHSIDKLDINDLRTKLENLSLNFNDFSESHSGVLDKLNIINDNYNELKVKTLGDYDGISSLYDLIQQAAASEDCLHLTGGSMTGDINVSGSHDIGSSASKWNNIYVNNINGNPVSSIISQVAVNLGTANALAYYSGTNAIDDALHLRYYEGSSTASTPASYYRLHLYGSTYGNTAANMISGTAGLFSFGDGGPQITFDTNATPGGSQAGALIFTDHDAAATGASWHFVSNQGDWNVTSKRFHARTGISVGSNLPNTSYNFYVNGTSYLNGVTEIPNLLYINDYIRLGQGGNIIDGYRKSTSAFTGLHLNYYSNGNTTLSCGGGNVGIGTSSPTYKLDVSGDINTSTYVRSTRFLTKASSNANYAGLCAGNQITGSLTADDGAMYYYGKKLWIWATELRLEGGNFWATGGVTALATSASDKRLKKEIKPFNAKSIIDKLKPVEFEWNKKANKYNSNLELNKKNYGLIAQDSDNIIDNLVFDLPDGKGYKGVRYEKLIPILLQAIKEQQNEINELKKIIEKCQLMQE